MNITQKNADMLQTANEIHKIASDKGFWDVQDSVLEKMENLEEFTRNDILQVHKAFISQKLLLIITEISEGVEADRESQYADWGHFNNILDEMKNEGFDPEVSFIKAFEGSIKDTFEDELADSIIRILDLCKKMNIKIFKHIQLKVEFNKTRDKMHGKDY